MSRSSLSLDTSFLYSHLDTHHCITPETQAHTQPRVSGALGTVNQRRTAGEYGFIEVLRDRSYLEEVENVVDEVSWAKTLVVVGVGGSDLGARTIQNVFQQRESRLNVVFHGDSTDPEQIEQLWKKIDLETTVFNIVSKSGQTVETISQYVYWKQKYQEKTHDWQKHFVFTTDPKNGVLHEEADKFGVTTLRIPPEVGGRFSVLTPVGLFPAMAMGVDVRALVDGALQIVDQDDQRRVAEKLAQTQYQLYMQETKLTAIMPYSIQLEEFARWFRQLWAESLGKDDQGILPIQSRGPADQHSQLQFYMQGSPLQSILFLRVNHRDIPHPILEVDVEAVQYLAKHDFHEIINIEQEASALALFKVGRPSATLSVDRLDEYALGQLFMLFEYSVVCVAEMLGVDAFNQPGVEESKQMMYALLGRDGFEEKRQEIESLRKAAASLQERQA